MPDSLAITYYLASAYPSLVPQEHEAQIRQLLQDLHAINYFSLSFGGGPGMAQIFKDGVQRRLDVVGISERYRAALEVKAEM